MFWIHLSRLFATRIRIHQFCIDFKEVAVAVKTGCGATRQ